MSKEINRSVTHPSGTVTEEVKAQGTGEEQGTETAQNTEKSQDTETAQSTETAQGASAESAGKKAPRKKKKKKTTAQMLAGLLIKLAAVAVAAWLLFTFVLSVTIHYGNNMHPAVRDGDLIIGLRVQRPFLNAAVLYEHDGKTCLGRVVGMPGNTIDISDEGALTVNGAAPAEEVFYPTHRCETASVSYPYTVGEDQVFILNDFRPDTADSRSFGAVDIKDVKGPVLIMMRRRGF